jgi:hypothetical protein
MKEEGLKHVLLAFIAIVGGIGLSLLWPIILTWLFPRLRPYIYSDRDIFRWDASGSFYSLVSAFIGGAFVLLVLLFW